VRQTDNSIRSTNTPLPQKPDAKLTATVKFANTHRQLTASGIQGLWERNSWIALKAGRGGSSLGLGRRSGDGKKRTDERAFAFAA